MTFTGKSNMHMILRVLDMYHVNTLAYQYGLSRFISMVYHSVVPYQNATVLPFETFTVNHNSTFLKQQVEII